MDRRKLLKGAVALPIAGLAAGASAESGAPAHHPDGESYHDKYWQAQAHIDELERKLAQDIGGNWDNHQSLRFHPSNSGPYLEMTHDGDDILLKNPKTGREIRL